MSVVDNFIAPQCHQKIEYLFQDEHLLVINKPSGLLSLSGKNPLNKDSVHFRLAEKYSGITLVHRLDFGTSGVMVLAKHKTANAILTKQFQDKSIDKQYISILDGHLLNDKGQIELPIAKDPGNFPRLKICNQTGKVATTHYQVIERLNHPERTRVLFTPLTGRTHQLRIHSQGIGHPILGCDLYGSTKTRSLAPRLLLHASQICFNHPTSHQRITLASPSPF
ncbi:RluA family pseudouridine synthase [Paraglaciecola aquimarina]|uniref:RluA family pseudouridine synthase n=1 Tax=Paraglaciecola aquimarina TaxID=1235557 RepID=A0ABU3SWE3_9ALTE|nr:RluA family pseudouridine synthase [Paraglaciecola aquimarina]MDU0354344.1 RluA family pseudouridine synthase [Paraglaciecola aquimarina]